MIDSKRMTKICKYVIKLIRLHVKCNLKMSNNISIIVEEALEIIHGQMDINEPEMVLSEYINILPTHQLDIIVIQTPSMQQYTREGRGRFTRRSEIVWKCLDVIRNDLLK